MIDKDKLQKDLTAMVAYKFDMLEQQFEGKYPPFKNNGLERYRGRNLPPPYVELNTFKNEVDNHVTIIMLLVDEADRKPPITGEETEGLGA